jgi:phosphoglycerate dehydrogenase-like enzyme
MTPKAIFLSAQPDRSRILFSRVYAAAQRGRLEALVELHPEILAPEDFRDGSLGPFLREVEYIFSTWGMPKLEESDLQRLPKLKAVFYAAGTVQGFARPLLARGITVVSGWAANAVPVAEFTAAQVILALKNALPLSRAAAAAGPELYRRREVTGAYGATVALISMGMIGRRAADLLRNFDLKLIAYEPYAKGEIPGVELVSLDDCFTRGNVVSLHAPNLPATRRMIKRHHFESMRPNATFINTARGAIVDQEAMIEVLSKRPDLTAIIDVTDPHEPAPAGSAFYTLPNLFLTPHVAGSAGNEVARMAEYIIDELDRHLRGQPLKYAVTESMLETMA